MIANCGHDERGKYAGGVAGDQTRGEYAVINWYSRPWSCVLRYPDELIGQEIARISQDAARNDRIGYDQYQRLTYYNALKACGWEPSRIQTPCESDCSASTAAALIAVGHLKGLPHLKALSPSMTTYNMRSALRYAGFRLYTQPAYTANQNLLLPGDILLNDSCHVAVNLTRGSKVQPKPIVDVSGYPLLKLGATGPWVELLQNALTLRGYPCTVDKTFGAATEKQVRAFQTAHKLEVDGVVGQQTWSALFS